MKKTETKTTEKKAAVKSRKTPTKTVSKAKSEKAKETVNLPMMKDFPSIKKGDKNGYVTVAQTNLKNRGYYDGPVNGVFDEKTEKAVTAFQKDLGKPLNGSIGPKTWEQLQTSTVIKVKEESAPPLVQAEKVKSVSEPVPQGSRVLIEGLSRYQADLLVKLFSGHTECRIL